MKAKLLCWEGTLSRIFLTLKIGGKVSHKVQCFYCTFFFPLRKARKLENEIQFLKASKNCENNEDQVNYNYREKRITPREVLITSGFNSGTFVNSGYELMISVA